MSLPVFERVAAYAMDEVIELLEDRGWEIQFNPPYAGRFWIAKNRRLSGAVFLQARTFEELLEDLLASERCHERGGSR